MESSDFPDHWWIEIDRENLHALIRTVVPDGGLIVVCGTPERGLAQAKELAIRLLTENEYQCVDVSTAGNAGGFRNAVLDIASQVSDGSAQGLPADLLALRSLSPEKVIEELEARIENYAGTLALIVDGIDDVQPLLAREIESLMDLAENAKLPIVVTSSRTQSSWRPVAFNRTIVLGEFTPEDVFRCLVRFAPTKLGSRKLDELQEHVKHVTNPATKRVSPRFAYSALKALSRV
jgi:hypothetical protein